MTFFSVAADSDISGASQNKKSINHPKCIKQLNVLCIFRLRRANFLLMSCTACVQTTKLVVNNIPAAWRRSRQACMGSVHQSHCVWIDYLLCLFVAAATAHSQCTFFIFNLLQTSFLNRDIDKNDSKAAVSPPLFTSLPWRQTGGSGFERMNQ